MRYITPKNETNTPKISCPRNGVFKIRLENKSVKPGVKLTINDPLIAGLYISPKKKKKLNPNRQITPTNTIPLRLALISSLVGSLRYANANNGTTPKKYLQNPASTK